MLPEFDIGRKVGAKIRLQRFRRAVVLCVVDVADFDGSLPRAALKVRLASYMSRNAKHYRDWRGET